MQNLRRVVAALLLGASLFGAACSAEGNVSDGEDKDGVKIEGDIDANKD